MADKKKMALMISALKPPKEEAEESAYSDEKVIAAEELQEALSVGSPEDVAEAFQSMVTLCS